MEVVNELTGFERFVHERSRGLWRAAWLLTGDPQHADDLVQTALAKTWGRYDSMENDNQFEAYVRTTIYRTFCSWWRKRSWQSERPTEFLPEQLDDTADQGINLDLRRALDELPRMQRSVIVMQYFEDLPLQEIADRLGIAPGTAKAHASRAKAALRESPHLAAESTMPVPDPKELREGARRKRRKAQVTAAAVAVVALIAAIVPIGLLWPGQRDPQVAEPSPTPSESASVEVEAPTQAPEPTVTPVIEPSAEVQAPVVPEEENDPPETEAGVTVDEPVAQEETQAQTGNEETAPDPAPEPDAEAPEEETPVVEEPQQDENALALVDPHPGVEAPAPKACFDDQGQFLQPGGGIERGATRAWLCTNPSWYAESSPLEPLVLDVDRVVDLWEQLPDGPGECLSEGEAATPITLVLESGDRKQVVGIDPLNCGGTTDGATQKGSGDEFLSMLQAFWLDQRSELGLRSAPKVAGECPAPGGALVGTAPNRAAEVYACNGEERVEVSADLQEQILAGVSSGSSVGQVEGSDIGELVLADSFGNPLVLTRNEDGSYDYVMPGQTGPDSVHLWQPSEEMRGELDALFTS